ncbi:MAG TPA: hypothetical protein VIU87_24185 [Mycobacterium sp.]
MSTRTTRPQKRPALSRELVLAGAVALTDDGGVYYVATKTEIFDAIVDVVFSEIDLPTVDGDWRAEIHLRATSARHVLQRHS